MRWWLLLWLVPQLVLVFLKVNNHHCTLQLRSCCSPPIRLANLLVKGGAVHKVRANLSCHQLKNLPLQVFPLLHHPHIHPLLNGSNHKDVTHIGGSMKPMQKTLLVPDGVFQCIILPLGQLQCYLMLPLDMDLLLIFLTQAASCLQGVSVEILVISWRIQQNRSFINMSSVMVVECNQLLVHVTNLM
jgi:hypothetical protein